MSTIDRDPLNKAPVQEGQLPNIDNVLPVAPDTVPDTTRREVREAAEKVASPAPNKLRKRFAIGATALGVGGLTVVGAVLGINAANNNSQKNPYINNDEPVATGPAVPGSGETDPTTPETVKGAFEIEAGLSAEQFAKALYEENGSAWLMAGTTPQTADAAIDYFIEHGGANQGNTGDFSMLVAKAESKPYIEDLYIPGANPTQIDFRIQRNAADIERWLITQDSGDERDLEAYKASYVVNSAIEVAPSDTGRTMEITYTAVTNQDKNRIGSDYDTNGNFDGSVTTVIVTTQIIKGVEKIASETLK